MLPVRAYATSQSARRVGSVQLLELDSDELDVASHGIYVVDDDDVRVLAGPFDTEALAVEWIDYHALSLR